MNEDSKANVEIIGVNRVVIFDAEKEAMRQRKHPRDYLITHGFITGAKRLQDSSEFIRQSFGKT